MPYTTPKILVLGIGILKTGRQSPGKFHKEKHHRSNNTTLTIFFSVCLQILYDKNGAGIHLRKFMGWPLAWWHNYKWATYRIITVFAVDFIGPLFHNLFPDRTFNVKQMSVPSATAILSYIRLSYPAVNGDLDAAIALGNTVKPSQMILLKNMRDLFEYFIPTVGLCSLCCCVFFSQSFLITSHRFLK